MVEITVKEIRGNCPVYKVGDKIRFNHYYFNSAKSANICIHAMASMATLLTLFSHGNSAKSLGIGDEDDIGYIQCPDPGPKPYPGGGTVIFEIKR